MATLETPKNTVSVFGRLDRQGKGLPIKGLTNASYFFDRQQQSPGSEKWLQLDATLKEGLRTFMPALKEASTQSTALSKMWFELKCDAGFFLDEASEDQIKQVVVIEHSSPESGECT